MGSCELVVGSCELMVGSCELMVGSCELMVDHVSSWLHYDMNIPECFKQCVQHL